MQKCWCLHLPDEQQNDGKTSTAAGYLEITHLITKPKQKVDKCYE